MDFHDIHILMVEDNANVLHLNRTVMERQGYQVFCAESLQQAQTILAEKPDIDVAVLDIMLPDGNGLELAAEVKKKLGCPVLMLTSKRSYNDIVTALTSVADDYMTKPYRIEELTAHIQVLLKKRQDRFVDRIRRGALSLDIASGRAYLGEEDLLLAPREFLVLYMLVEYEGQVVAPQALYERAWRLPAQNELGAVKTTISRLRKKLEPSGYTIESERGAGYRLQKGS